MHLWVREAEGERGGGKGIKAGHQGIGECDTFSPKSTECDGGVTLIVHVLSLYLCRSLLISVHLTQKHLTLIILCLFISLLWCPIFSHCPFGVLSSHIFHSPSEADVMPQVMCVKLRTWQIYNLADNRGHTQATLAALALSTTKLFDNQLFKT